MSVDAYHADLYAEAVKSAPRDRDELHLFVTNLMQIPCPRRPFHAESASPLDMAWAMWEGKASTVTIASRGSYKTLLTVAMEHLIAHHQKLWFLHFAAGDDQVRTAQGYLETFCDFSWWKGLTDFSLGEIKYASGGRILPRVLSKKNVRSKHVCRVIYDESDEMDPLFYRASINICDSLVVDGDLVKGCTHHISTHNRARGIVDTLRNQAAKNGRRVMQWNYRDVAETCPESRRGTGRVKVWVNTNILQRRLKSPAKPDGWQHVEVFDKCPDCALVATCKGDLADAHGTRSIQDLIEKITDPMMTADDWHSQQDNLRPSTRGLAVPEWDEDAQVRDFMYDPELGYSIGVDFSGGEHNAVIIAAQKIPIGWPMLGLHGQRTEVNQIKSRVRVFDELVVPGGQFNPAMCQTWVRDYNSQYGAPHSAVADPSQLGNTRMAPIGSGGRGVYMQKADNNHHRGYSNLRRLCVTQGDDDHPPLEVHPRCERFRLEMGTVRKKMLADGTYSDEVEKRDDDALDGGRYVLLYLVTVGALGPVEATRGASAITAGGLF